MDGLKFSKSFWGFKPSSVFSYIKELENNHKKNIEEKQKEIEQLLNQNDHLKKQLLNLEEEYNKINQQKIKIAELLITAQEKAESIVSQAIEEGESRKKELYEQIKEHEKILEGLKDEIRKIKLEIEEFLGKYEKIL